LLNITNGVEPVSILPSITNLESFLGKSIVMSFSQDINEKIKIIGSKYFMF